MGTTHKALIFAAVAEAATGLALLIVPSLVGQLLLGEELTGTNAAAKEDAVPKALQFLGERLR